MPVRKAVEKLHHEKYNFWFLKLLFEVGMGF